MKLDAEWCLWLFAESGSAPASLLLNAEHPEPPKPVWFPHCEWWAEILTSWKGGLGEEQAKEAASMDLYMSFPFSSHPPMFLEVSAEQAGTHTKSYGNLH